MVRLLLSRGANINAFDKRDRRAIHWAAYMGKSARGFNIALSFLCLLCLKTLKQLATRCSATAKAGPLF